MTSTDSTEAKIQQECYLAYWNQYCLLHHVPRRMIFSVPNEGQVRLRGIGLYPGVSDLVVFHHPHPPIFVEVKTPEGKQSPAQKKFQAHIESLGYRYHLVRSLEEFQVIITDLNNSLPV